MFRRIPPIKYILLCFDLAAIWIASYLTIWLRYESEVVYAFSGFDLGRFMLIGIATSGLLPLVFKSRGLYRVSCYTKSTEQLAEVTKSLVSIFYGIVLIFFFLRGPYIQHSRSIVITLFIALAFMILFNRLVIFRQFVYPFLRESKLLRNRVLIVGAGEAGQKLVATIVQEDLFHYIVGLVDDDPEKQGLNLFGKRVLGRLSDLDSILESNPADEIVIAINSISYDKIMEIFNQCKDTGKRISIASRHFEVISKEAEIPEEDAAIPSATFNFVDVPGYKVYLKNAFDRLLAAVFLIVLSPIWLAIAAAIKLTSKGPVLFKTTVIGRDGNPFVWYKFRTMRSDMDDRIHRSHVEDIIKNGKNGKKIENDPRITPIGAFLRRYSLDEFPQLINVLKGQMSLVGPRPCLPYEYALYSTWHKKRFKVTPGLTGLWQVFGRNKVTFDEMVILDIYYSENYSIWLDFKILFNTAKVVLTGKGGV